MNRNDDDDINQGRTLGDKSGVTELLLEDDVELNFSQLENELMKKAFKKVGRHYESQDVHYTVRVSSKPNKARVIFGYNLIGNKSDDNLDNKVKETIRSVSGLRSMPPIYKGGNYAVGFSIIYKSANEVFQRAEKVSEAIKRVVADYFQTAIGSIGYIDATLAHSMQIEYLKNKAKSNK